MFVKRTIPVLGFQCFFKVLSVSIILSTHQLEVLEHLIEVLRCTMMTHGTDL